MNDYPVFGHLLDTIAEAIAAHPRSRQAAAGPSELGTPCARRLAYKMAGVPAVNDVPPAWKPTVGTAVHTWLEQAFTAANTALSDAAGTPVTRWVLEQAVTVGQVGGVDVTGRCDCYDRATATVIDFKVLGVSSLRAYKAGGPSEQYRTQVHLYGAGFVNAGHVVDTVGILGLPQNGNLADAWTWAEPYDPDLAAKALDRADGIATLVAAAGAAAATLLPTADAWCSFCPWHMPAATELTEACPGHHDPGQKAAAAATTRPNLRRAR